MKPADVIAALEAKSVAKAFPDGTQALQAVDLTVPEGEFVTLIGPSGCGKSTLLRLVAGLSEASAGELRWWGERVLPAGGARGIVFVFQSPTLMPWARVRANVRLPLDLAGVGGPAARGRVDAALELVGLSQFAGHYPRQLSGGMQMRASIARALVNEPRLLLMDEPFAALDEITRNRLDEELMALWLARRFSVLFVTHSIYEAVFLSTSVHVMSARPGRIAGQIRIDEPYPRSAAFRTTESFAKTCGALSDMLVRASAP